MKITKIKKLVQVGGATGLVIPKYWIDHHNLVKGDKITLIISDSITITPTPENKEEKTKSEDKNEK